MVLLHGIARKTISFLGYILGLFIGPFPLTVVDGDTVKIQAIGERLRLESIDAPERGHRADCPSEAVLAEQATQRLVEIVNAGVRVIYTGERGGWGRPLIHLRTLDGQAVGEILVTEGLAVPWAGKRHEWYD